MIRSGRRRANSVAAMACRARQNSTNPEQRWALALNRSKLVRSRNGVQ
jgi:hypothetical protein